MKNITSFMKLKHKKVIDFAATLIIFGSLVREANGAVIINFADEGVNNTRVSYSGTLTSFIGGTVASDNRFQTAEGIDWLAAPLTAGIVNTQPTGVDADHNQSSR